MIESFMVLFREGTEAFLIVAIMLAYVTKAGRNNLVRPIQAGIVVALIISATTGWHVAELAQDPVWEGTLAMLAGALVASFTVYVMRTAKNIRENITRRIDQSAAQDSALAEFGVFAFTVLMVAREGMESALMLGTLSARADSTAMLSGAGTALLMIAVFAVFWVKHSHRINLKIFMQVTGTFLIVFSLHLFAYGLHELSEMAAIPFIGEHWNTEFHVWSEPIESPLFMNIFTLALIAVPFAGICFSWLRNKTRNVALQSNR